MIEYRRNILYIALSTVLCLSVAAPASAIDLGGLGLGGNDQGGIDINLGAARVSVGTRDGVNANIGANTGGASANVAASALSKSSIANVNTDANVGGSTGLSAKSSTSIGGGSSLFDSNTTASIGGNNGVNAKIGAKVGQGGVDADVDVRIGRRGNGGDNGGKNDGKNGGSNGGKKDGGSSNRNPNPGVIATRNLSADQVTAYRKYCVNILRNPTAWDRNLVEMCRAIRQISTR